MKKLVFFLSVLLLLNLFIGCQKENETIDTEAPTIDIGFTGAFPVQCSELTRGERFVVKARFADNVALGSYSIDIHDNFDHHSHSTELQECTLGEKKQAVNPLRFTRSYDDIPENATTYETNFLIEVPENVDPGDYHFMIQVTDHAGWSSRVGLSVKIK